MKSDYVIKTIGQDIVVVPIKDEAVRFNGIISLNHSGKFLFELLQKEDLSEKELLIKVMDQYDVSKDMAKKDIQAFIKICQTNGLIDA